MANKGIAIVSSVGAIILASGIALETTGRVFGGTWNGPMWLAARARYGLLPANYAQEDGYNEVSQFITDGGRGVLKVTVDEDGKITETSYTAPATPAGTNTFNLDDNSKIPAKPQATIVKQDDSNDDEDTSPTRSQPTPEQTPAGEVEPNGDKVYYGWHAVWAWCGNIK